MHTHPAALRCCRKQAIKLDQGKVYTRRGIARICHMSHTTLYKFLHRYEEQGEAGLYDKERGEVDPYVKTVFLKNKSQTRVCFGILW